MNIPMKYEDVVAKLDAALGREADLIASANQNKLMMDAACGEIATLQEELAEFELVQQRLTVAELALKFYADGDHLLLADADAWDTCSGEPCNFLHDDAGTASVEDGSIAKAALKPDAEGEGS